MKFRHVIYCYWVQGGKIDRVEVYSKVFNRSYTKAAYRWFDDTIASLGKMYNLKVVKVRDSTIAGYHINLCDGDGACALSYELR